MSSQAVEHLSTQLRGQFAGREPCKFQVQMIQAQEERCDAICQAATGMGKTAITAGPYALEKNKGRVTFMISPLIGLQNEMAETFQEEYHVSAIAVNSAHRGYTWELMRYIIKGKYQIVLISPEMLLSRQFIDNVLCAPELASWTPFIALSASLTQRVTLNIVEKLQFTRSAHLYLNLGNNRPNMSLAPYNAVHTNEYRTEAMQQFRSGDIRILVCTDTTGMGCNIPDIDIVVQWKLPDKLSSFVQRAGRAARAPNKTGLAILLVEPNAYSIATHNPPAVHSRQNNSNARRLKPYTKSKAGTTKKASQDYARAHGHFHSGWTTAHDVIAPGGVSLTFNPQDPTEGLYLFVQATTCRRSILCKVFDNPEPNPMVVYCDIYNPTLLNQTQPGTKKRRAAREASKTAFGRPSTITTNTLRTWHDTILAHNAPDQLYLTLNYLAPNWQLWPKYGPELS
ncbi:hypothetical protein HETIRDRAFT_426121 [Heterobasidion irregulare TC 32-1]|uniref:DNA 3'-5' helicase n=1 Tax=Heterobasidion irregulare (strain TC 32-1) TaxID=747525 RepID=W4K9L5_HETIT|nr:uncharacterized protein HETIRDRAFT_426121 [Heterobasidion irregulare TC 32-1]ETW82434.1 hypothetical protein HETIRDRAFT_426121 [Heterobasidion irregulare TC 32-1]